MYNAGMFILDIHTHVFPDDIAHATVKRMAESAGESLHSDGTVSGLVASMDANNVSYSATMPVATKPEQVESINNWTIANRNDRIIPFGAMHPGYENPRKELGRIRDAGMKGIKLHPDYQGFYPSENRIKPVLDACRELGLIVLFHAGDDFGHPRPGHSLPRLLAAMADSYQDVKFIFAHLGGYEMWDQAEKYLVGKPVFIDTSYSFPCMTKERAQRIIRAHGPGKVLLGSDSPWGGIGNDIGSLLSLSFTDSEKEMILGANAAELLDIG